MKVTKIRLPNGIEVEGEFSLDELTKLPIHVPAAPQAPAPAPLPPPSSYDPMRCTCPKVWMGIFPPPPCAYCEARGVKLTTHPMAPYFTFVGVNVNGFSSIMPKMGDGLTVGCPGIIEPVRTGFQVKN